MMSIIIKMYFIANNYVRGDKAIEKFIEKPEYFLVCVQK